MDNEHRQSKVTKGPPDAKSMLPKYHSVVNSNRDINCCSSTTSKIELGLILYSGYFFVRRYLHLASSWSKNVSGIEFKRQRSRSYSSSQNHITKEAQLGIQASTLLSLVAQKFVVFPATLLSSNQVYLQIKMWAPKSQNMNTQQQVQQKRDDKGCLYACLFAACCCFCCAETCECCLETLCCLCLME